jgi:hypothetical protein
MKKFIRKNQKKRVRVDFYSQYIPPRKWKDCSMTKNKRIDIKAILNNPKMKAELIANAVRSSRFFK